MLRLLALAVLAALAFTKPVPDENTPPATPQTIAAWKLCPAPDCTSPSLINGPFCYYYCREGNCLPEAHGTCLNGCVTYCDKNCDQIQQELSGEGSSTQAHCHFLPAQALLPGSSTDLLASSGPDEISELTPLPHDGSFQLADDTTTLPLGTTDSNGMFSQGGDGSRDNGLFAGLPISDPFGSTDLNLGIDNGLGGGGDLTAFLPGTIDGTDQFALQPGSFFDSGNNALVADTNFAPGLDGFLTG